MNKLFTKIATLALGATMAFGVGVSVAAGSEKASEVKADTAGTSWVEDSVLTSSSTISSSDKYVLKSPSGYYYKGSISSKWGETATTLSTAAILTLSGSQSGFTIYNTQTSKYLTYTASNFTEGATGVSVTIASATITGTWAGTYNGLVNGSTGCLKCNTGSSHKFRWYSGTSYSSTMIPLELVKLKANKTLSSIAVSGYTTSFTVGDTFAFGGTVTATYSDSSNANVTSGTTFSGYNMNTAGNYTVTASYTEGGVTKTATYSITVAAATSPTLSFDKTSFSGYTGQSVSVTATFANLESDLAWSSAGTGSITGGSITWSSSDHRNGTSTYTCTLSGEGGKTIVADADGVDAAQCVVTITQTTVDITKASTSISVGRSETLAASHNASSVGGLNWTSSDNSIATVGSDGKVTVDSNATVGDIVTITARSSVDTSVADTCTVTVAAAPLDTTYDFRTNFSTYASSWGTSYGSHTVAGTTDVGGDYAATITFPLATKQTGTITTMPVVADQASGDVIHISFELTASGYTLGDVSVTFAQWGTKAPTMKLFKGSTASGDALDTGVVGTKNTISASDVGGTTFVVAMNDNSTSRNQVGVQSIYISLVRENKLDHVTVSFTSDPADRTFYAGSNFAFNGTLTASYTVDAAKAVTPTGYFLDGEEGEGDEITTSTILTVADYNGGEVYVQYTEGGVTKYDSFTLVVNPAPATSVTLSTNSGSVALEEIFKVSDVTATVQPSAYATQGVTWEVYDSDGLVEDDTYVFDGAEFYATEPADVVFHVKANSNGSVYASFTLTITGDPIVHLFDGELIDVTDGSTTVFADAGVLTYGVTTENFEGTITYGWSTSSSATIAIDDDQGDTCDFLVKAAGSARLSCRVQGSTKGDVTVYIDVTVSAVTVTSVTWSAPTIDVFSGTTLSSTSGWNVKYSTNSGKTDQTPDSFNIKLGGTTISLPHTWVAADDTKTLCVEVGGVSSSTTTVAVTQSINAVTASLTDTWDHTFTAKAWSDSGDWTISEKLWTMSGTDDGSPYFGYDGTKGQQFGSGTHPFSDVSLQSSAFSGTIDSVVVYTSGANSINATVQVSVGGTAYGSAQTITNTNTAYTFDLGGKSGTISIDWVNSSSKAIYVKEIVVNTATGSTNIANDDDYKAAQRAVVAFAQAFNEAMDDTENCTTGLDAAWSTCSSAYTSFQSAAAALGETQEERALNLVKHATRAYSDDSPEACLERMMKTYEICVQKHGKTAFMSDLVTLGRIVTPVSVINNTGSEVAIIVVTSMIGLTAVGGYFFLRRRKEHI